MADVRQRTGGVGGTPVAGTLSATTSAAALGSQVCDSVLVQNPSTNTVNVLVGDSSSQPILLEPGRGVSLPVSNVSSVFAKTATGTATVAWVAMK